jgi:hypothetical protein
MLVSAVRQELYLPARRKNSTEQWPSSLTLNDFSSNQNATVAERRYSGIDGYS